ncbi:MAG TPA: anthranilate synthase component I, partial [Bacillales bacterium]|nr:anthranilate synthase component I [Bacillales bacterium]
FILESRDEGSPWSRYSFIGLNPYGFLTEENGVYSFQDDSDLVIFKDDRFSGAFRKALRHLQAKPLDTSVPFYGGAVGTIGYDAVNRLERVPEHQNNDLGLRKFSFLFCETILAFDHHDKELQLFHHVRLQGSETKQEKAASYREAVKKIDKILSVINGTQENRNLFFLSDDNQDVHFERVRSNYRKEDFIRDVDKIKEYIRRGDIFQAVLSQRFEMDLHVSGLDIYRVLRIINPSPYLFYLKIDGVEVVGSSPERLVQVQNRKVEIHPIAGTRKRGATKEEDDALAVDLAGDEKELAEHFMLVDLARNDVGRVAKYGTVNTPVLTEIGRFSHVMHLISKVTGELADGLTPIDALLASFPAGTVSGAPKIRAMQILQELEPTARNLYAGAVGYLGFDGNIDSCITIRTLVIQNGKAYIQAGAGIVADSDPLKEWEESRNKAKALVKAVELAEEIFSEGEKVHV